MARVCHVNVMRTPFEASDRRASDLRKDATERKLIECSPVSVNLARDLAQPVFGRLPRRRQFARRPLT